jgi:hypothetical protein
VHLCKAVGKERVMTLSSLFCRTDRSKITCKLKILKLKVEKVGGVTCTVSENEKRRTDAFECNHVHQKNKLL